MKRDRRKLRTRWDDARYIYQPDRWRVTSEQTIFTAFPHLQSSVSSPSERLARAAWLVGNQHDASHGLPPAFTSSCPDRPGPKVTADPTTSVPPAYGKMLLCPSPAAAVH